MILLYIELLQIKRTKSIISSKSKVPILVLQKSKLDPMGKNLLQIKESLTFSKLRDQTMKQAAHKKNKQPIPKVLYKAAEIRATIKGWKNIQLVPLITALYSF